MGLSSEFTALKILSAINMGLTSLEGLPALPSLQKVGGERSSLIPRGFPLAHAYSLFFDFHAVIGHVGESLE